MKNQNNNISNNSGFIMLLTVIIISAITSVILIKTSLSAISHLQSTDISLKGLEVKYFTEGCVEEALINLNRDNAYAGGTFTLGDGSCEVTVSGSDNSRTLNVSGNLNDYYSSLSIDVTLDPFAIVSWDN